MTDEKEKISCHICKKEIPKAAALSAEGEEYVFHFCDIGCFDYWNKEREGGEEKKSKE